MEIDEYLSTLRVVLDAHPYGRVAGTNVHVGPPTLDIFSHKKRVFAHLLCLFVTLDMKVYECFREHSPRIKEIFRIPIFEHGLTGVYWGPNRLFEEFDIRFDEGEFEEAYLVYFAYLRERLFSEREVEIDLEELERLIIADSDLGHGLWGRAYQGFLATRKEHFDTGRF